MTRIIVTEADRKNVRKWAWGQVARLDLPRKDRMLLATRLELAWWDKWRAEQAKAGE